MVHWARLPVNLWNGLDVSNGNRTGYDNQASSTTGILLTVILKLE